MTEYLRVALVLYVVMGHAAMTIFIIKTIASELWHDIQHGITHRPFAHTLTVWRTMVLLFVAWPYVLYRDIQDFRARDDAGGVL